jgi:8-oxo-dGTP pyrophosphatase MutT (NUDIX family)
MMAVAEGTNDHCGAERLFAEIRTRLSCASADAIRGTPDEAPPRKGPLRPAAVLVGLVADPHEIKVLLTRRSSALRVHSGQIAFPGGRIEPSDANAIAAALREAREEIGLEPSRVEPLGVLGTYVTGTGFRIVPVVAKVVPPFVLALDPNEVADAFEVPFGFLMNAANHRLVEREMDGERRTFYAMPYAERYIWGVTAGILRNLYERLYG